MLYTHYMQLHQSKEPFAVHLGNERRRMIPNCLCNHALPTQNRRCLAEGLPYQCISMQILQKAMEQRNRKQDSGKRAKLRRAAPRDEHNIGQVSGDTKNSSSQGREHERASQLQKVVHTDPLALANSSDPRVVRIFFSLTNITLCKSMIYILACVLQSLKKSKTHKKEKIKHLDLYELATEIWWFGFFFLKMKMLNFVVHQAPQSCVEVVQLSGFMH